MPTDQDVSARILYESAFKRGRDQMSAIARQKFNSGLIQMAFDGARRNLQSKADLFCREALGRHFRALQLPPC